MIRFLSEGSISWRGVEYPSLNGIVEVPNEAAAELAYHGVTLAPDDEEEPAAEPKRRGRPPKVAASE